MSQNENKWYEKIMTILLYILIAILFIGVQVLIYWGYLSIASVVPPRFESVSYKYDIDEFEGTMWFSILFIAIWYAINIIVTLVLSIFANKFFNINVLFPILTWFTGLISTGFTLYSNLMKSISNGVTDKILKDNFADHLVNVDMHIFIAISIFVLTGFTTTLYKSYIDLKDKKKINS